MEVAQQIRIEANGQSANALRVQQQLRTQIQGSRSIDAQLTGLGKCPTTKTPAPRHEKDQKVHFQLFNNLLYSCIQTFVGSACVKGRILLHDHE